IEANDYPALARFCATFPGEKRDESYWLARFRFWWEENPAFSADFPRGGVLENHGQLGGMFALIPGRVQFHGQPRIAANMSCWRVLPHFRGRSLALFLMLLEQAKGHPVFNTTPTPEVETILHRVPFIPFAQGIQTESVWVSRPREGGVWAGVKRICQISWNWSPRSSSRPLPLAVVETLAQHYRQMTRLRQSMAQAGTLAVCETPGPAFDRLWQRTGTHQAMTNVRTGPMLEWYLKRNPNPGRPVLLTHEKNGELRAFGLFARRPSPHWPDREHLDTLDVWAEPSWEAHLLPLLGFALHYAREAGIPVLRIPHYHPDLARLCAGIGLTRPLPKPLPCYYLPPRGESPPDPASLHPSRNMGDYGC
ncbi:MAG: hypothetical protein HQM00_17190, partial [Magnetococcales bacterium]|nr:hypothetical protein [Magnetococcales bacterium]